MGYTKYTFSRDYFKEIDTEEKAYWLGFIAADGCIGTNRNTIRVDLKVADKNHLEKLRTSISGNQPIVEAHGGASAYIDMNSKGMVEDLLQYGLTPNKSLTLNINFDLIPEPLIHHFIRGYFDGDGSINYYTRAPYWYDEWELSFVSTQAVLLKFQEYFNKPHKLFTCGKNFRFCYKSKQDIKEVLEYMYQDASIYLDRKYQKVLEFLKPSETTKKHP